MSDFAGAAGIGDDESAWRLPACSLATSLDLGGHGQNKTVRNDACLRVGDAYPVWWDIAPMQLQITAYGGYRLPFTWSNACSGSGGTSSFDANWESEVLRVVNEACPTLIHLQGDGTKNVELRYYKN